MVGRTLSDFQLNLGRGFYMHSHLRRSQDYYTPRNILMQGQGSDKSDRELPTIV